MSSSNNARAIIVAAGRGERFGASEPKQFIPVAGRPLLAWTLDPFLAHPEIAAVSLVLPPEFERRPPEWLERAREDAPALRIVAGGAERSDSVRSGLRALEEEVGRVVIHDGARPMVTGELLSRVLAAMGPSRGAIAARPVTDTLKEVDEAGAIVRTVSRRGLWRAETPQAFPASMLRDVYERARQEGVSASDCAALCERYGVEVGVVEVREPNVKVTRPEDLQLVAAWLARRASASPGREA